MIRRPWLFPILLVLGGCADAPLAPPIIYPNVGDPRFPPLYQGDAYRPYYAPVRYRVRRHRRPYHHATVLHAAD